MARAAVLYRVGEPLEIVDDVEVAAPRAGEVRIRVACSGICHSDLSAQNGTVGFPLPVVLGHEGAGVVTDVGPGVSALVPGDHVVVSWVPQCGTCFHCARSEGFLCDSAQLALISGGLLDGTTRLRRAGVDLHQMAVAGTFSDTVVVPATGAVKIPVDVPLSSAALIGCGVLTGVGAALNSATIPPGDSVAVIGCGGVGLNVIQGAVVAGAGEIIAIDAKAPKLELARRFGATQTILADGSDVIAAVLDLTGGRGVGVAFEVIGLESTIHQALRMARKGGQAVLVGAPGVDVRLNVRVFAGLLTAAKSVVGCWYGATDVRRDVPRILELHRSGRLQLEELISRRIPLDAVNEGLQALATGDVARIMVEHSA
jgi:S-(hydroxymethyl)glutathione dehydrogenase / alcohol dehydrogenase